MKTLYLATVTIEQMVVAESEDEAMEIGFEASRNEIQNMDESNMEVSIARGFPHNWTPDCLVYHSGKEDITLEDALKTCTHKIKQPA